MKKIIIGILAMLFSLSVISNVKAEEFVAKIGDMNYTSLDEAVEASKDGDTITLLKDAETEGLNLSKDLTIDGKNENGENYKVTFTKNGIALWGKSLTFKNTSVLMINIGSTPYTVEWNWMTICASKNSTLNLINSDMVMDGKDTVNKHAIYFTGNDILNLTNSNLTISNYAQDALEWDGGDAGYNVNIKNSTVILDHNRSGFTGTFIVKAENSNIDVINSTGNGSNGSHFSIVNDSIVKFNDNKAHGLSTSNLIIDDSYVEAKNNGGNGIHVNGLLDVKNYATIMIEGNECAISSKWTIPGAFLLTSSNTHKIDSTSSVAIKGNYGSGISLVGGTLNIENGSKVSITENTAYKLGIGGGIYVKEGTEATLSNNIILYNNHATTAGDDIYSLGTITFSSTGTDWYLNKGVLFDFASKYDGSSYLYNHQECEDKITGWFDDTKDTRWEAHQADLDNNHIEEIESGTYNEELAIKAAHGLGKVNVHYVTVDGEVLHDVITMTGVVGSEYATELLDFYGYKLSKTEGDLEGTYTSDAIEVTYIYDRSQGSVISNYVDVDGKKLADSITYTGYVGDKYKTEFKDIFGYKLIKIEGDDIGTFEEDTIYVTYIYMQEDFGKGGDEEKTVVKEVELVPPQTGLTGSKGRKSNFLVELFITIGISCYIFIKRLF
ncbi:MAG: MucBP domain-containing protein [bacterium]|nr:MucBP domain-containing protein [bacterium]